MRKATEGAFPVGDGEELFYRSWLPHAHAEGQELKKAVILFHRGHEHSGRFQEMIDRLDLKDYAFFAWDCRGCGKSPGPRGDARGLGQLESDMDFFFRHLCRKHSLAEENVVVLAHSVAAVVAGLWVLDYGPRIRGLILATPALEVKLYVPFAREGLSALSAAGKMKNVTSYVRGKALTHDRNEAKMYDRDPLISKQISTRLLLDLYKGSKRLQDNAHALEVPTQVLVARADWVIRNAPIAKLFQSLPNPRNELKAYRGFFHAIFHEEGRGLVFEDVRAFVQERFREDPCSRKHLLRADRKGIRAEQYQWLKAGTPPVSVKNLVWKVSRASLKSLGRVSQGMRLGLKRGFSSGETLDYVYENRPRGWTVFGRAVDFFYLNSIGWICIRQRKRHLDTLLEEALDLARSSTDPEQKIRVSDLAGGPGRYLLDVLEARPEEPLEVIVRDMDEHSLARGRELAIERKESRIKYFLGDAFNKETVAQLEPLDVAVVSGLYELFPDNAPVQRSLEGLARAVKPGGYLIYTNQPSHPTLELIAETLTHSDGSRWVMRCRSTAEMDELARTAGFLKLRTLIDEHGIFSVSLAQRME
jgi:alpha-beta hydrolase superfamily lysophospholipase/SAM-dependent methyltransferase